MGSQKAVFTDINVYRIKKYCPVCSDASISGSDALMWHSTHQVDLEAPLSQCGVREMSVIDVTGRVRGGGGDGGSTGAENRTAYMEMYKRKKVGDLDKAEESIAKWVRCTLSGEVLAEPVVCDEMGSLYNKEAVVHGLMEQLNGGPKMPAHLTLKTIIELKLSR